MKFSEFMFNTLMRMMRHNYGFMASSVSHWSSELETLDQILAGTLRSSFVMLSILLNFGFFFSLML